MYVSPTAGTESTQQNTATQNSTTEVGSGATIDYNTFLRLLIAQMKNQDPTNPTDPAQWIGQLASFSGVEQSMQTNAKLDTLMTSMALSQADSLVGRNLTLLEDGFSGKIESVRIISGGTVAVLEDGTEILLGAGVEIS